MKMILETQLVAATPISDHTNTFVTITMNKIRGRTLARRLPVGAQKPWFHRLSKPAIALLALLIASVVGGAVYAAIQFAPDFVKLLGKETNPRGATEYSAAGLAACATNTLPINRFELKTGAPANSDDEVRKILQARCEMEWLQNFPDQVWPEAKHRDGNTQYYVRLDMLGTFKSASNNQAVITLGGRDVQHYAPQGQSIRAFAAGKEIPLSNLKPGDVIFTISSVSETVPPQGSQYLSGQPKVTGLVGLFKMSLPLTYYMEKQAYLTDIPACLGNPNELCPNTAYIDIYPAGSEGATNPYRHGDANDIHREISGSVTQLSDSSLTLKTRSGALYTATVGDSGFGTYNRVYKNNYTQVDATLKIGSNVTVRYNQPAGANPQTITKEQVGSVELQLESINPKKDSITQY